MKILVAKFQLEANEHVDMKCDLPTWPFPTDVTP